MQALKRMFRRSRTARLWYFAYTDWQSGRRLSASEIASDSGNAHAEMTIDESLDYIDRTYKDYLRYAGVSSGDMTGMSVLEIGPGDNLGVALRFLMDGARRVACVDRFYSDRDEDQQRAIYRAMWEHCSEETRRNIADVLSPEGVLTTADGRLESIYGRGAEEVDQLFEPATFDLAISRAVLEHVADPRQSLHAMDAVLRPNGIQLHKVDLRDHGMFTEIGLHPLEFLTISPWLYPRISANSGRPNRALAPFYEQVLGEMNVASEILVTRLLDGSSDVDPHVTAGMLKQWQAENATRIVRQIRKRLAEPFGGYSDLELSICGIFIVARKAPDAT